MRQWDKILVEENDVDHRDKAPLFGVIARQETGNGYNQSVLRVSLEELKELDEQVSCILRPTVDQVYQSTLDNLFDGESEGDVSAPSGWFAIVHWPNGFTYLIVRDELGFTHLVGTTERSGENGREWTRKVFIGSREELSAMYQRLCDDFASWADIAQDEM